MRITSKQLARITGREREAFPRIFTDSLNRVLARYHIDTPLRAAHFLAQVCHESGGFRYREEIWGPTRAQKRYEGRSDLGNTVPGDGYRYRGRGYIQLTGRYNYNRYGAFTGEDFEANPDRVAELPWALDVAGWYWTLRDLSTWADADDIGTITRRVNGGYNGLQERRAYLAKAKEVLMPPRVTTNLRMLAPKSPEPLVIDRPPASVREERSLMGRILHWCRRMQDATSGLGLGGPPKEG